MTKYNSFIVHNDILYTDMDIEEIERKVEISLYDKDSELVTFHILKLTGNMVKMVFYRDFPLEEHDTDSIFDTDMNLITGFSMNCFRSKEAGGYPLLDLRYNDYNATGLPTCKVLSIFTGYTCIQGNTRRYGRWGSDATRTRS